MFPYTRKMLLGNHKLKRDTVVFYACQISQIQ